VNYTCQDKTAFAGTDFTAVSGTLSFAENERTQKVFVEIIDNDEPQPDRDFVMVLSNITTGALVTD
jgi:hypothetical protein